MFVINEHLFNPIYVLSTFICCPFYSELSLEDTSKWLIIEAWQCSTDNRPHGSTDNQALHCVIGSTSFRVSDILRNRSVCKTAE